MGGIWQDEGEESVDMSLEDAFDNPDKSENDAWDADE